MSSHREAPEISKDPVADSTDVYAFVSPDRPDTVTLIANYIPLQEPAGGPNFYEFGDDVLYEIHIDNSGGGAPDISYQFRFTTKLTTPSSFLYNTGPIGSLSDPNWNSKQFTYSILGLVAGDPAGFPNGRRVTDDVVTIELRAIAGVVYPLIDPSYKVDAVVPDVTDGLTNTSVTNQPLTTFPYLGVPYDGYDNPS